MANAPRKIEFNENHRRAISIVMRGTERSCDRILEWLERPSSLMTEVRDDLTSAERAELRKLVADLREEVHGFAAKAALDRSPASRRRSVAAILSTALIDLQEVRDSELKGYGRRTRNASSTSRFSGWCRCSNACCTWSRASEG
jgi:Ni,Fe-hydrogenase III large subunit